MTQQTVTTAGAGTFTVPANITTLTIEAWGAGGGGDDANENAPPGGGGGGYSIATVTVTPGQTVFFTVGTGGTAGKADHSVSAGNGGDSWVNPSANSEPVSGGVVGGGGFATADHNNGGLGGNGSVGTSNFKGGNGSAGNGTAGGCGGAGGGGAGSAGAGVNAATPAGAPTAGGAGGTPDGGGGGSGVANGPGGTGTQPGGGGGAPWLTGDGGAGANGQVRFTWISPTVIVDQTTLTNVPGKHFTKKQYGDLLGEIRDEAIAVNQLLEGLSDKDRADLDFDVARAEFEELENSLGPTNYAKAMDAKERLDKARKARDHHYFMEIVNKEIAKYNESKKKQ